MSESVTLTVYTTPLPAAQQAIFTRGLRLLTELIKERLEEHTPTIQVQA